MQLNTNYQTQIKNTILIREQFYKGDNKLWIKILYQTMGGLS